MNVAGWRIYYADGSVVQSQDDVEWEVAPDEAVTAVIVFYKETFTEVKKGESVTLPYRHILQKEDYYWQLIDRTIVAGSLEDLKADREKFGAVIGVKRGLVPDCEIFERIRIDVVF